MKKDKAVIYWLLSGCVLVFLMVVVGGITRLTNSGLSMTDWHLVTDTLPPLTEAKWQQAFDAYKQFPEYLKISSLPIINLSIFGNGSTVLSDVSSEWFLLFRLCIF